jgi:hypothetical protein
MTEEPMVETVFVMHGHTIDLDELYRAMHAQSVLEGGVRVFLATAKVSAP